MWSWGWGWMVTVLFASALPSEWAPCAILGLLPCGAKTPGTGPSKLRPGCGYWKAGGYQEEACGKCQLLRGDSHLYTLPHLRFSKQKRPWSLLSALGDVPTLWMLLSAFASVLTLWMFLSAFADILTLWMFLSVFAYILTLWVFLFCVLDSHSLCLFLC